MIHYHKVVRNKKKQHQIGHHQGIDPGPLVQEFNTLTTRLLVQIVSRPNKPYILDTQSEYQCNSLSPPPWTASPPPLGEDIPGYLPPTLVVFIPGGQAVHAS